MVKLISATKNGVSIYEKNYGSHNSLALNILKEAISKIELQNEFQIFEIDMMRNIGFNSCVETSEEDKIIYKRRKFRKTDTRFVLNREAEETSYVVIILKKTNDNSAYIVTAYSGRKSEKEVGDPNILTEVEREQSEKFWSNHALVYENFISEINVA